MNRFALPNKPVKETQLAMVTGSIHLPDLIGKMVCTIEKVDMSSARHLWMAKLHSIFAGI